METMVNNSYISYNDFKIANLTCTPPESKTVTIPGQPTASYWQIAFLYKYGKNCEILSEFYFEGCEMETSMGIMNQAKQGAAGQQGRVDSTIMCKFDLCDNEQTKFINTMNDIHTASAGLLAANKGVVKLYNFDAKNAEATGLKNPVYRPRDQNTGEIMSGRAPSIYFKLLNTQKLKTVFTDPANNPISWNLLENVEMKFIPLFHVKRIYIGGGKASIQMEIVSAIITSIRARGTATRQLYTIDDLKKKNPNLADSVAAQLEKLTMGMKTPFSESEDKASQQVPQIPPQPEIQPSTTFEGLSNSSTSPDSSPVPKLATLPSIPNIQDLSQTAPIRPSINIPTIQKFN